MTCMGEWGICNYQPYWNTSAVELLNLLEKMTWAKLKVQSIWSLWDCESNEWFNDAPVVICTPENQLEFCATKLNKFSISLNLISLSVPVYWCGDEDPDAKPLYWKPQQNPEFSDLVGKSIVGIEIVEFCFDKEAQTFLGLEKWVLSGIALQLEDERLEILNGLDCNTLSRSQRSEEWSRYIQVMNRC